jgi:Tfp pilus assembly protein PilZ
LESRKDKRFEEQNNVLIRDSFLAPAPAAGFVINAHTHDLSMSGARICSQQEFPVGYVIRIVIDLKRTHQSLNIEGEVVWLRECKGGRHFDLGVRFIHNISDTVVALIKHLYGKGVGIPSSVS